MTPYQSRAILTPKREGVEESMHPITLYRRAKGLTQTEVAARTGVSITSVQAWERGVGPSARNLPAVAELLGVDPVALVREIDAWRQIGEAT